jgi:UDP-N-acetylmuramate dehydrogenase
MTGAETADRVEAAAAALGDLVRRAVALGQLTTYKVGGPAALLADVRTLADLDRVADAVAATGVDVLVMGKGSNLLVADAGFPGLALVLGEGFAGVEALPGAVVRAGGAAALPRVARWTVREGLTRFEWAVGVPGSIGGAVRMNAGGHGSDMAATLVDVELVDLDAAERRTVAAADLALGYRRSAVTPHHVVVSATLQLAPGDRAAGERTISEIVAWRRANQPGGQNAGSVFTNPDGDSAGRLVDAAGGKGLRVGTAEVSTKHANFIQADPGGSADDVLALMAEVRRRVAAYTGVELHAETRTVGFRADELAAAGVADPGAPAALLGAEPARTGHRPQPSQEGDQAGDRGAR